MKLSIAVVGATGAVGREMIQILERRNFPCKSLRLLASARSVGTTIPFAGEEIRIEELVSDSFKGIDLVLASAGAGISRRFAQNALDAGALWIDNSSAFRMDEGVPLVVPEVNPEALVNHRGVIGNPNCSTILMVVALAPIERAVGIKRVVVSTYQAASGAGSKAMDELALHSKNILDGESISEAEEFAYPLAFNCIPHIDVFQENGYTREEMKMVFETRKILGRPDLAVSATTVRVPVMRSHSESINIETKEKISAAEVRELLGNSSGIEILDDPASNIYPMATQASGRDPVYVGRIREDDSISNGINLWVVGDQLLKGAALNSVQIAEILLEKNLIRSSTISTS